MEFREGHTIKVIFGEIHERNERAGHMCICKKKQRG